LRTNIDVLRNDWIQSGSAELERLEHALAGHRIFSTIPRLALFDPDPPLMEPYLLTYLHRLGKVDLGPIVEPIRRNEYDAVITDAWAGSFRGVKHLHS